MASLLPDFSQPDKKAHGVAGTAIAVFFVVLSSWLGAGPGLAVLCGLGSAVGAGFGKEVWDMVRPNGTGWNTQDFLATVIGGIAGSMVAGSGAALYGGI